MCVCGGGHANVAAAAPHNPGFLTAILPGSPGYALYPSAQVPLRRVLLSVVSAHVHRCRLRTPAGSKLHAGSSPPGQFMGELTAQVGIQL